MIPDYLQQYVAEQKYDMYTAIDQAGWRYIMRVSKDFFKDHAHVQYLNGLEQTGITIDHIPRITEMNKLLKKFDWQAAVVTGFIPPAVFLEFLSLSVLPIACDMRRLDHLEYTPAPDIVHEAAGHAPMISDPKFAAYLHKFGEVARRAIFAKEDIEVYEAVKYLSDIKEDPKTSEAEVKKAYARLDEAGSKVTYASEATQLSRLGWWSTEYGLVKNGDDIKIYGAGLLSSVDESYKAIHGQVPRLPLTVDCVNTNFDITKQQPQLFYVENFSDLEDVIVELAATMAFRIGGLQALERAKLAGTVTTAVLETGIEISGILTDIFTRDNGHSGEVYYLQFTGPTQLSRKDKELPGHSADYHKAGFGTPLGKIKNLQKTAGELSRVDLERLGFLPGEKSKLEFESGVVVEGVLIGSVQNAGRNLILSFEDCRVSNGTKTFFDPAWGTFDMACGEAVVSVFGGAADRAPYLRSTGGYGAKVKSQSSTKTAQNAELIPLYQKIRDIRETRADRAEIKNVLEVLDEKFPKDWLLRLEILEILPKSEMALRNKLEAKLEELAQSADSTAALISRGRALI